MALTVLVNGDLKNVEFQYDELLHLNVPQTCPNVPSKILNPINTWEDKDAYNKIAAKLSTEFSAAFDKSYGDKNIDENIKTQCPGK